MNKQEICQSVCDVYNALNTIRLSGYKDCKTFTNCMESLNNIVNEIIDLQVEEEIKTDRQGSD